MSERLTERIANHLATISPHIKQRRTAELLIEALAELRRLQSATCPHCGDRCDLRTEEKL